MVRTIDPGQIDDVVTSGSVATSFGATSTAATPHATALTIVALRLRIAAYIHVRRTLDNATGVGRHAANMVLGLAKTSGVDLTLMASARELERDGRIDPSSPLSGLPVAPLPLSHGALERLWWQLQQARFRYLLAFPVLALWHAVSPRTAAQPSPAPESARVPEVPQRSRP